MKKTFLFLAALAMSAMMMADVITIGPDLFKSSYGDGTIAIGEVNFAYSGVCYNTKGTPTNFAAKQIFQLRKSGSGAGQISNNDELSISQIAVYLQNDKDFTLSVGDDAAALVALEKPTATDATITVNHKETGTIDAAAKVYTFTNIGGKKYFQILNGSSASYVFKIEITTGGAPTPARTLQSIYVSGTATKLEYIEGESFDVDGLKVMGKYDTGDDTEITAGIEWTIVPGTLALGTTSVSVTAQYKDFTSEAFTVNNIVVKKKPAAKYVPVAWNEIEDGGKYFITANNDGEYYFAAKAFAAKGALAIAFDATLSPEADMWTFTKSGNVWKISAADGAGLYMNNDNNGLVCAADKGADFTVAQGSSAEFTDLTASDGSNTRYVALYNQQDFRCYKTSSTSGIRDLKLYGLKKEGVITKPSFTPAESEFDGSVEVTLSAEEGAAIYYTLDGTTPTDASAKYENAFTLTTTTTIKAIAVKDGKNSDVAEKTYNLVPVYTLAELVAAGAPTADKKKVILVLENEVITGVDGTRGIYVKSGDQEVEIFCYNLPETAVKGAYVSGRAMGDWFLFGTKDPKTWELQPADWSWATFTKDPTALQQVMQNANIRKAMHNGRMFILKDNKMFDLQGMLVK